MNNSTKAECVRAILSKKLTNYETSTIEMYQEQTKRQIGYMVDSLEINEKTRKTLEAIKFLLESLNY